MLPDLSASDVARFWAKVDQSDPDGCWLWTGYRMNMGYGIIVFAKRRYYTHRVGYTLQNGPIPDALFVCHHCDVPACVRGDHLFLGTCQDNMTDAANKGRIHHGDDHWSRQWPERVARGERNGSHLLAPEKRAHGARHGMARLTETDVLSIRHRHDQGTSSIQTLANEYGFTYGSMWTICRRQSWKHLP